MAPRLHQFYAIAFEENLALKQLASVFPQAKISAHELYVPIEPEGGIYVFPFGALVAYDLPPERREAELARLFRMGPKLTAQVIREDYSVLEDPSFSTGIVDGVLRVDRLTPARAGIVSLIVAQSAAMEYYERIVDRLSTRTQSFVERLERRGTVPLRTRRCCASLAKPSRPAARCFRYSICWTSPTRRGTTRRWIGSTKTSGPSSTWSTAIGRSRSSCALCRRHWNCWRKSRATGGCFGSS
jgi:Uncharacterised ACR, YagE family COG1723